MYTTEPPALVSDTALFWLKTGKTWINGVIGQLRPTEGLLWERVTQSVWHGNGPGILPLLTCCQGDRWKAARGRKASRALPHYGVSSEKDQKRSVWSLCLLYMCILSRKLWRFGMLSTCNQQLASAYSMIARVRCGTSISNIANSHSQAKIHFPAFYGHGQNTGHPCWARIVPIAADQDTCVIRSGVYIIRIACLPPANGTSFIALVFQNPPNTLWVGAWTP